MSSKSRMSRPGISAIGYAARLLATLLVAALAASFSSSLHAADIFKGQKLYQQNCAACHGLAGRSVMPNAPNFAHREGILKPDLTLLASIRSGRNAMPAFQGILTDRDIMDVIAYVRTLN